MPTINIYPATNQIKVFSQEGPPGPPGPQGPGFNLKGSVPTEADLPSSGNLYGDFWITESDNHGWIWNRPGNWSDLGISTGPPGAPGPQGIQGLTGPTGNTG